VSVAEGVLLWEPSEEAKAASHIARYMGWLRTSRGRTFGSYADLWAWSVSDIPAFWTSVWEFSGVVAHRAPRTALADPTMPGADWFPGAELNFAEHALRRRDGHPAVVFRTESGGRTVTSYAGLSREVAVVAAHLRELGVRRGDRVVAYLPNIPAAVTAFLATAAIGAVWSVCAPEFGVRSVSERFRQLEPKVLIAADGYRYNGRRFDRTGEVRQIQGELPSLERTILVPYLDDDPSTAGMDATVPWPDTGGDAAPPAFEPVPFGHPLWVLYSSGATGPPKGIVHSHGGILLEQLKSLPLHLDLGPLDRFLWFTTTGWMMWNRLVSGLLTGATIVLYDGSPAYPDLGALWSVAAGEGVTYLGVGAPYILSLAKAGLVPGRRFDLTPLRALGCTGAPLPPEAFRWVYERVKPDLLVGSLAGGTDVCTSLAGSCALLPVHAGEIQCRCLGARVEAFDPGGRAVTGEVGELVVTAPMPSMPVALWKDDDGRRYHESYFAMYPGVWRHGDWVKITPRGTCVIYGRSDSTLNRGGVRMGTSEFYRVVEEMPEVADSLVVHLADGGGDGDLVLFVVLREGAVLEADLDARIRDTIRSSLSPRHVPDRVHAVGEIPRTLNGKKLEVPVRRILMGTPPDEAVSPDAMQNPGSLVPFLELARRPPVAG
jgi:acetoacetyl-CoA synthetase